MTWHGLFQGRFKAVVGSEKVRILGTPFFYFFFKESVLQFDASTKYIYIHKIEKDKKRLKAYNLEIILV